MTTPILSPNDWTMLCREVFANPTPFAKNACLAVFPAGHVPSDIDRESALFIAMLTVSCIAALFVHRIVQCVLG